MQILRIGYGLLDTSTMGLDIKNSNKKIDNIILF